MSCRALGVLPGRMDISYYTINQSARARPRVCWLTAIFRVKAHLGKEFADDDLVASDGLREDGVDDAAVDFAVDLTDAGVHGECDAHEHHKSHADVSDDAFLFVERKFAQNKGEEENGDGKKADAVEDFVANCLAESHRNKGI